MAGGFALGARHVAGDRMTNNGECNGKKKNDGMDGDSRLRCGHLFFSLTASQPCADIAMHDLGSPNRKVLLQFYLLAPPL